VKRSHISPSPSVGSTALPTRTCSTPVRCPNAVTLLPPDERTNSVDSFSATRSDSSGSEG
jgi:hypothetical protein